MVGPKSKPNQTRHSNSDSFLEALRGLGSNFVDSFEQDVVKGIPKTAFEQITGQPQNRGELKPNQLLDFNPPKQQEVLQKAETLSTRFGQEFLNVQKQERLIWNNHERETQLQIASVMQELKKITSALPTLAAEIQKAADQIPVHPGVYHTNFFDKLRQTLIEFRKKVDESATWLSQFNKRASKKGGYWGNFKKHGTKYLLSADRYMSTQVG